MYTLYIWSLYAIYEILRCSGVQVHCGYLINLQAPKKQSCSTQFISKLLSKSLWTPTTSARILTALTESQTGTCIDCGQKTVKRCSFEVWYAGKLSDVQWGGSFSMTSDKSSSPAVSSGAKSSNRWKTKGPEIWQTSYICSGDSQRQNDWPEMSTHNSHGERVLTSGERIEIMGMTQWHSPPKILGWCGKSGENEK